MDGIQTSALLLTSQLVSALPFYQVARSVPSDVAHIAHDEENGLYIAYNRDGSLYGTYSADVARDVDQHKRDNGAAASCTKLSADEAKTLPGFAQIEKYASGNWGTGSHRTETNPDAFLDEPVTACVGGDIVRVELNGSPNCITDTQKTEGELVGTNGTVRLGFQQGFSNSATWTVTKSSTLGVSVKVGATFKIPEILDVSTEVTTSTEFTNSVSQAFTTTINNMASQDLTLTAPSGKMCSASFNSTTCDTQGKGKIRYLASGWVWYIYRKKIQGHFHWGVNMDVIIPNEDDRSSFLEFTGSMKSSSSSNFVGKCE